MSHRIEIVGLRLGRENVCLGQNQSPKSELGAKHQGAPGELIMSTHATHSNKCVPRISACALHLGEINPVGELLSVL